MANISHAIQAKSDQLNYDDFGGSEKVITVTSVKVDNGEQPVAISYQNDNGKPYKPCKGMLRLISAAWGDETDNWLGKSMKLYGDNSVKWAGQEVGGIRISEFSHIPKSGLSAFVALSRGKRRKVNIAYLETAAAKYKCPKCSEVNVSMDEESGNYKCGSCNYEAAPKTKKQGN